MQCCCGESATVHCLAELAWYFINNNYVVLAVAVFMWLHLCCIMPSRMCDLKSVPCKRVELSVNGI